MIVFADPWYFLLLLLLPLLWWLGKRKGALPKSMPLSTASSVSGKRTWRIALRERLHWLKYLAFAACVLALARPQFTETFRKAEGNGIDIMLAMDISPSMLSKDFSPDRLAVAKKVAIDFVESRQVDRIGLVSFAGEALIEHPLTTDHSLIKKKIDRLNVGLLSDGTAIGMGLGTALTRLRDTTARSRIVILLTDGESNAGYYTPQQAIDIAIAQGIKVYTIGIGTDELAMAPIARNPDGSYEFAPRVLTLDDSLLEEIAQKTGGRYFLASSESALREIYAEIDRLEKSSFEVNEIVNRFDLFHFALLVALLFLLLDAIWRWWTVRTLYD